MSVEETKVDEQVTETTEEEVETEETETETEVDDVAKRKSRFKKTAKELNDLKKKVGVSDDVDVEAIVAKKMQEKEITMKVDHIKSQIPEQYREAFEKEFAELTEGKTLSSETVDKYISLAVKLSIPDDKDDADAVKAMAVGNSVGGSITKQSDSKTSKAVEYSNKLLKDQGIL